MSELRKAQLQEVSADSNETPVGDPVPVQFNPTTLTLRLSNQIEGGNSAGRQRRQHNGASSNTLSMELVFDSADEGTDDAPVNVRTKTAIVEKYVVPRTDGSETPPRVRFEWNEFFLSGIVDSLDIDFDLFAANGVPLRAKVKLSIKEQDPKYQYLEAGSGARNSNNAQAAGGGSGALPGGDGPSGSDLSALALEGETAAEFSARLGLDPGAWRGLDIDLSAGLSLSAGLEVGFSAGVSLSAGIGVSVGVQASASASLEASLGITGSIGGTGGSASGGAVTSASSKAGSTGSAKGGSTNPTNTPAALQTPATLKSQPGFALSSAGGIHAAIETVKISQTTNAANAARQAFSKPDNTGGTAPVSSAALVSQRQQTTHSPLTQSGTPSWTQQQETPAAALPPKVDARSASFGFGVPLRVQKDTALGQPFVRIYSSSVTTHNVMPPIALAPGQAPWEALPAYDRGRQLADKKAGKRAAFSHRKSSCCNGGVK